MMETEQESAWKDRRNSGHSGRIGGMGAQVSIGVKIGWVVNSENDQQSQI